MSKPTIRSDSFNTKRGLERVLRDIVDELRSDYPGNIYFAVKSTEDYYDTFYQEYYEKYKDNSVSIQTSIQGAIDAATADRGDLILVMPGKWQENVLIFEKDSICISAVAEGWETQMRPSDGATKYPMTTPGGIAVPGFAFVVLSRSVDIRRFCMDGGGGFGGVYVGDGYRIDTDYGENTASAKIHDNLIRGGNEGVIGVLLDGASADVRIDDNIIEQWTRGIELDPGGDRTTQQPKIRRNDFLAKNAGYGVDMYSDATTVGALVRDNSFRDGPSATFTYAIRFQGAGVHSTVKNSFACANKISASSTDFCSGDTFHSAGNAPHFLQDSVDST